jgi:hypothetical protein
MSKLRLVLAFTVLLLCTGCATLFTNSSADISVNSDPEGASIYVDGLKRGGETPTDVTLDYSYSSPWKEEEIVLKLNNYEDREFEVNHGIAGWYWGNFLLGPFAGIGGLIDIFTGSWASVDMKSYNLELREATSMLEDKVVKKYAVYTLNDLENNDEGEYIIPDTKMDVAIHDIEADKLLLLNKK